MRVRININATVTVEREDDAPAPESPPARPAPQGVHLTGYPTETPGIYGLAIRWELVPDATGYRVGARASVDADPEYPDHWRPVSPEPVVWLRPSEIDAPALYAVVAEFADGASSAPSEWVQFTSAAGTE